MPFLPCPRAVLLLLSSSSSSSLRPPQFLVRRCWLFVLSAVVDGVLARVVVVLLPFSWLPRPCSHAVATTNLVAARHGLLGTRKAFGQSCSAIAPIPSWFRPRVCRHRADRRHARNSRCRTGPRTVWRGQRVPGKTWSECPFPERPERESCWWQRP